MEDLILVVNCSSSLFKATILNSRSGDIVLSCLGRCESGPAMVIYPEARWYTYVDEEDLQEILDQDLAKGEAVARLLIDAPDS